jgi:hypothetical protein
VVDHLHLLACVDAGEVREQLEPEIRLVVEGTQDVRYVAGADPDLGLIVALPDDSREPFTESRLEAPSKGWVHVRRPPEPWVRWRAPASDRGDP